MSTPTPTRNSLPRRIEEGEVLVFARFNKWVKGASFRGGFLFKESTYRASYFPGMERTMLLRNPGPADSPRRGYGVVVFPRNSMLFLFDFSVDLCRGIVLELASFRSPQEPSQRFELAPGGPWASDVLLAGQDLSHQTWAHHIPVRLLRKGIEPAERWLFRMKQDDVMVREI